jgi:hypothetical protein
VRIIIAFGGEDAGEICLAYVLGLIFAYIGTLYYKHLYTIYSTNEWEAE